MGMADVCRMREHSSKPSMPGIMTSSRARSGFSCASLPSASVADVQGTASMPEATSTSATRATIAASSSTTRTLGLCFSVPFFFMWQVYPSCARLAGTRARSGAILRET